jgi:hypothetical protein
MRWEKELGRDTQHEPRKDQPEVRQFPEFNSKSDFRPCSQSKIERRNRGRTFLRFRRQLSIISADFMGKVCVESKESGALLSRNRRPEANLKRRERI